MTYRLKSTIFLTLAVLLAGCANNTDMPDVSAIQDSVQAEQTAYQNAAIPCIFAMRRLRKKRIIWL